MLGYRPLGRIVRKNGLGIEIHREGVSLQKSTDKHVWGEAFELVLFEVLKHGTRNPGLFRDLVDRKLSQLTFMPQTMSDGLKLHYALLIA